MRVDGCKECYSFVRHTAPAANNRGRSSDVTTLNDDEHAMDASAYGAGMCSAWCVIHCVLPTPIYRYPVDGKCVPSTVLYVTGIDAFSLLLLVSSFYSS